MGPSIPRGIIRQSPHRNIAYRPRHGYTWHCQLRVGDVCTEYHAFSTVFARLFRGSQSSAGHFPRIFFSRTGHWAGLDHSSLFIGRQFLKNPLTVTERRADARVALLYPHWRARRLCDGDSYSMRLATLHAERRHSSAHRAFPRTLNLSICLAATSSAMLVAIRSSTFILSRKLPDFL
jgi:hypothetical protein